MLRGNKGDCVCIYVHVCLYIYMCVCVCVLPAPRAWELVASAGSLESNEADVHI